MDANLDERRSATNGLGPRELPILFHLMDVSRPRPAPRRESFPPKPLQIRLGEEHQSASNRDAASEAPSLAQTTAVVADRHDVVESPILPLPLAFTLAPAVDAAPLSVTPRSSAPAAQVDSESAPPTAKAVPSPALSQPSAEPTVVPKPTVSAGRKLKRPVSEDWFASHGRFIAAAFVLALIGTIYFARTTRRPPVATAAVDQPLAPVVEFSSQTAMTTSNASPAPALVSPTLAVSNTDSASLSSAPKVELHVPLTPQVAAQPASDKPASSDSLFVLPTGKSADERVATRTETPVPSNYAPSPVSNPHFSAQPVSLQPSYPVTSSPSYPATSGNPLTGNGPAQPLSSVTPPPAAGAAGLQSQAWTPPSVSSGMSSPYQPLETTARGQRYERTGSGNY